MTEMRLDLISLNECITCKICNGYLIDATAIPECLHTFCKSCLVRHLHHANTCPDESCKKVVHYSNPLKYIRSDPTLQELVYKLVPNLLEDEAKREDAFYRDRGIPNPKAINSTAANNISSSNIIENEQNSTSQQQQSQSSQSSHQQQQQPQQQQPQSSSSASSSAITRHVYPGPNYVEKIGIELVSLDEELLQQIDARYMRCPSLVTITHLKKYLALRLFQSIDKQKSVDILYNEELLGKDHTLKFVIVTRFKQKKGPLRLYYRPAIDSM